MAGLVGLSPSYFNQIEHDQRPLTSAILHRLCEHFGLELSYFASGDGAHLLGTMREILADPVFGGAATEIAELQAMVRVAPSIAHRFVTLYRHHLEREEQLEDALAAGSSTVAGGASLSNAPYSEVGDWVQSQANHFGGLEIVAERLAAREGLHRGGFGAGLVRHLRETHGIAVVDEPGLLDRGLVWRFDRSARRLLLAEGATEESRAFWIAHHVALIEHRGSIDRLVEDAKLSSEETRALARVALANYFAGAVMMPYERFLAAARSARYDVQRLQRQFGASFEQVCHRLSTMQRPSDPGIPFYFVKTDIAGNVLKRSSATRFQFTQFGGPCPLWNVYHSFSQPGQISVQLARTPDDVVYLNIARTVGRSGGSYLSRPRAVAVVLGCEIQYAPQLVYAAGLDLRGLEAVDPIGPGCRSCPRETCRHRALPPIGRALDISDAERGLVPYRIRAGLP